MGNDMFNDEQLAHAEIVQKETEEALGFWKERALKAEAKLADKYLIEEQYEAACGDRDGLLRMVETLREQKTALRAELDALLARLAPLADAATEAVREAADAEWAARQAYAADSDGAPEGHLFHRWLNAATRLGDAVRSALSAPPAATSTHAIPVGKQPTPGSACNLPRLAEARRNVAEGRRP